MITDWNDRYRWLGELIDALQEQGKVDDFKQLTAIYTEDLVDQGGFADWNEMIQTMASAKTLGALSTQIPVWKASAAERFGEHSMALAVFDLIQIDVDSLLSDDPIAVACGQLSSGIIKHAGKR